jgi:hypothetical protein
MADQASPVECVHLFVAKDAKGVVLFAHGSGSSGFDRDGWIRRPTRDDRPGERAQIEMAAR